MLIDFTVENFRSIKEPVTLSAIANPSREADRLENSAARRRIKPDNTIAPAFPVEGRGFALLPVLGIFGANASGKSNVLMALETLFSMIRTGISEREHLVWHLLPFRFDETVLQQPTIFRLRELHQNNIYIYSLAIRQDRVLEEILEYIPASPKRKSRKLLFSRQWNENHKKHIWKNGEDFAGSHTQLEATLQEHELFLTLLVKSLEVPIIEPITDNVRLHWPGLGFGSEASDHDLTLRLLNIHSKHSGQHDWLNRVSKILCRFDTGIDHLEMKIRQDNGREPSFVLTAWHKTAAGVVALPFHEESVGTQRLFALAYKMLDAFHFGTTMLIDELGSNIHPNITREIIKQFQSPKSNPRRAQLIFTSHDNTLQQRNLLRRDQIWFTAKRDDGSTELYPLTDFKPRNDLAIDKAYLDGRFGAVPALLEGEDLLAGLEAAR